MQAEDDEEPMSEEELWQADNYDYLDRVMEAACASRSHAGAELRLATRQVVLYGVGAPERHLRSVMDEAPPHVRVVWRQAPYTSRELLAEVGRLMDQSPDILNSGWPLHDGTGIGFTTTEPALLGADDPQAMLEARFPVVIEYGEPAIAI